MVGPLSAIGLAAVTTPLGSTGGGPGVVDPRATPFVFDSPPASGYVFRQYKVYPLPTRFFVDTNGVINTVINGPVEMDGASALIESLLPAASVTP